MNTNQNNQDSVQFELDFRDEETVWVWIPMYGTKYVEYTIDEVRDLPDSDFKTEILESFELM